MIIVSFKLLDKDWKVRLLKRKKYTKKNGKDSLAITYMYKRRIDIQIGGLDVETIIHELVHAYMHELCLGSTDINVSDLEEVYCELMSKRGLELLTLADELYEKLIEASTPVIKKVQVEVD